MSTATALVLDTTHTPSSSRFATSLNFERGGGGGGGGDPESLCRGFMLCWI